MLRKRIKVAPQHGPAGLRGTYPGACQRAEPSLGTCIVPSIFEDAPPQRH